MRSKLSFLFLFLLVIGLFTPLDLLSDEGTPHLINVGVLNNFPPQYSMSASNEPQGFAIDVIEEVAKLGDFQIEYLVKDEWSELFEAVKSGEADLIPNHGITEQRKEWFAFTSPVETFPVRIFVRAASKNIRSLADLTGRKVGVVRLNVGESLLADKPDITMVVYDHIEDALFDLLAGNVDSIIFPEPVLRLLARSAKIEDRITVVGQPLAEIKRAISVRKNNATLLKRLDNAVMQFVGSPAYEKIYAKWYGEPPPLITIGQLAALMVLALLLVVVGMTFWRYRSLVRININLNRSVKDREQAEQALQAAHDQLEERVHKRTIELANANNQLQKEIDDRKLAEKEIERLARIVEDALNEIFLFKTDTLQFIHVNTAAQRNLGYSEEEFKTMTPVDLKPEISSESFREMVTPLLKGKKNKLVFETIHKRKDNSLYNVEVHLQMLKHHDEALFAAIILDITERKKAEEALRKNEKLFRSTVENSPIAMIVVSGEDHHVLALNHKFTQLFGYSKKDIPNVSAWWPLAYPDKSYRNGIQDAWAKEIKNLTSDHPEMKGVEATVTCKDKTQKEVNVQIASVDEVSFITFYDLTERKLQEKERDNLINKLKSALDEIKTLRGILPICASCKKIRDDKGYWNQIESYICEHSDAEFSHGICPECIKKLYPDLKKIHKD